MGGLLSLTGVSRAGVTNCAGESNSQGLYGYPPPNGKADRFESQNENRSLAVFFSLVTEGGLYFSNHYYLGHRKFDTGEPEVFLFGELQDLNYLRSKAVKVSSMITYCVGTYQCPT